MEYAEKRKEREYVDYTKYFNTVPKTLKSEAEETNEEPIVILHPTQFGEQFGYDAISLTYFEGDKVLVDENEEIIDNAEDIVGKDFADHFGEYEDDSGQ